MRQLHKYLMWLCCATILFFACQSQHNERHDDMAVQHIDSPAALGSGEPNLFVSSQGETYLSWIEDAGEEQVALKFSKLTETDWAPEKTIASGADWFVNWADFPSIIALDNGTLAAHWLAKSGPGTYAYNVNIAFSLDGGETWSAPIVPHRDGTQTEHGFVSLLPWQGDRLGAVWLDGRHFANSNGHGDANEEMTLRFAVLDASGAIRDEAELDARTCECCQTSAGLLPNGAIVAYRDRSPDEIRDISVVRLENGAWSQPQRVFEDNWKIAGCPVNGPSLATQGESVAIAWFTAANQTPHVKIAFSEDGGKTFGAPVHVDDSDPMGRVDVIFLHDGSAVVCWMEYQGDEGAIKLRRVEPNGTTGESQTVARSGGSRASGFPRMVNAGTSLVFAWTKTAERPQVQTAVWNF